MPKRSGAKGPLPPKNWLTIRKWFLGYNRWSRVTHLFVNDVGSSKRSRCGERIYKTSRNFKDYTFTEWTPGMELPNKVCPQCLQLVERDGNVCGHRWTGGRTYADAHSTSHMCSAKKGHQEVRHACWCGATTRTHKGEET